MTIGIVLHNTTNVFSNPDRLNTKLVLVFILSQIDLQWPD